VKEKGQRGRHQHLLKGQRKSCQRKSSCHREWGGKEKAALGPGGTLLQRIRKGKETASDCSEDKIGKTHRIESSPHWGGASD